MTEHPGNRFGAEFQYLEFRPAAARNCGAAMVYLHGSGERGRDLEAIKRYGLPAWLANGKAGINSLVICPQLEEGQLWRADRVAAFLENVRKIYPRMALMGYSLGGQGVCEVVCRYGSVANVAIAIAGRCEMEVTAPQGEVSVLAIAGEHDTWSDMSEFVQGVNAAGGVAREIVLPDQGHYTSEIALENGMCRSMLAAAGFELRFTDKQVGPPIP